MGSRRREEVMRQNPFWDFSDDQLWLFNFHPISQNWNILISTHPFAKLKIVLESLWLREDMFKNPFSNFYFSPPKVLVTFHLPRNGTMSPRPRRNFRNMGFHFLTPIYHFLSKPDPNAKLVSYSIKTHTWTQKNTLSQKSKKKYKARTNPLTQLSL